MVIQATFFYVDARFINLALYYLFHKKTSTIADILKQQT